MDRHSNRWVHAFFFLVLMILTLHLKGYRFGVGDQFHQLPILFRLFDDSYLLNDWFVNVTSSFSVRHYFGYAIGAIAQVLSWQGAYLVAYVGSMFFAFDAVVRVTEAITGRREVGYLAAYLALVFLSNNTLCVTLSQADFVPRHLAVPLCFYGLWGWLTGRWVFGGIMFGLATLVHVTLGAEMMGVVLLALALRAISVRESPVTSWKGLLAWFVVSTPILVPVIWTQFVHVPTQTDHWMLAKILAWIRSPHHYVPSTMPGKAYLTHILEIGIALYAWRVLRPAASDAERSRRVILGWVLVVTVSVMVFSWFFTEVITAPLVVLLEAFQLSYWLRLLGAVGIATLLVSVASGEQHTSGGLVLAGIGFAVALPSLPISPLWLLHAASLAVLVVLASSSAWYSWLRRYRVVLTGAAAAALSGLLIVAAKPEVLSTFPGGWRLQTVISNISLDYPYVEPAERALYTWAAAETPNDAVFLIPPRLVDFRLRTKRAVVFDWKAIPFEPASMVQWFERLQAVSGDATPAKQWRGGGDLYGYGTLREQYTRLPQVVVEEIARRYGASYVVREADAEPLGLPLVFAGEAYRVYSVP